MPDWEPDFIMFGAQRAGTSWLDLQLRKSAAVCMPQHVKEVHYFDRHFAKGPQWYQNQWDLTEGGGTPLVGEITPGYLHDPHARARLAKLRAATLIVQLRNPWDRIASNVKKRVSQSAGHQRVADIASEEPDITLRSDYIGQLADFFDHAAKGTSVGVSFYEDIKQDPASYLGRLGRALRSDLRGEDFEFDSVFGAAETPRFKELNQKVHDAKDRLTRNNIHWPGRLLKRMGAKRLLSAGPAIEVDLQTIKEGVRRAHPRVFDRIERNAQWYHDLRQAAPLSLAQGDV